MCSEGSVAGAELGPAWQKEKRRPNSKQRQQCWAKRWGTMPPHLVVENKQPVEMPGHVSDRFFGQSSAHNPFVRVAGETSENGEACADDDLKRA